MLAPALTAFLALLPPPQGPATFDAPGSDQPDGIPTAATHVSGGIRLTRVQNGSESFWVHIMPLAAGTGFPEALVLHAPTQQPATPAPLVVIFHQFGTGHLDVLQNTQFLQAVHDRGWYLVCPLAASKKHMSSLPSQLNTEIVLDWVLSQPAFNIDTRRIYGIGFSMGGGAALNFAARHLDPAGPRLAAVINHTGTISHINAYADSCVASSCPTQFVWDFWFGDGSPSSADPLLMAGSALLNYDGETLAVDTSWDVVRNLIGSTPVQVVRGDMDMEVLYLIEQTIVFDQHMRDLGATPGVDYDYQVLPYASHDWGLLDEVATLDWLEQFTLATPTSGRVLADRNARFYHFDVVRGGQEDFARFRWQVQPGNNSVSLNQTGNVTMLTVHTDSAGLNPAAPLFVGVGTSDGAGDSIRLTGYPLPPSLVQRDGASTTAFTHDPLLQTVTLHESTGGAHVWLVTP